MIVGVDEVGRGSWAGPLCVAAVAWPDNAVLAGLDDSKKVPAVKRLQLAMSIRELAPSIGIGWASARVIDEHGLTYALKLAAANAVGELEATYEKIIVDGNLQLIDDPRAVTLIKADTTEPSVMAASIVAKVARDTYMQLMDELYAGYNFSAHVGYGTKKHLEALEKIGPCKLHRLSFMPVKALVV